MERLHFLVSGGSAVERYRSLAVKLWIVFSVAAILMFLEVALSIAVAP